ncbi:hypothetical protein SAMN05216233_10433 [Desulfoluna spongiiphila]|uniref:Uncharacterized protein n=1 Tax=Desulfoluna spongiiphila TaxID=419481 RepID=A0A1G5D733_9BACT|nr:hypothetical protein SAMN05216233_10433 [Desulfoluna spongiiphila]
MEVASRDGFPIRLYLGAGTTILINRLTGISTGASVGKIREPIAIIIFLPFGTARVIDCCSRLRFGAKVPRIVNAISIPVSLGKRTPAPVYGLTKGRIPAIIIYIWHTIHI